MLDNYGGGKVGEGISVGGSVGAMVAVPVAIGASVVLIEVWVAEGESVSDGVEDGSTGALVVGTGVRDGATNVKTGCVGRLVGLGPSLGVLVGLGVMVERRFVVCVTVLVRVTVRADSGSHGATSVNPWLYVSNMVNNLIPASRSLSVNPLPAGC